MSLALIGSDPARTLVRNWGAGNMGRSRKLAASVCMAMSLAGCASIRGGQQPLAELRAPPLTAFQTATRHYDSLQQPGERERYRDRIIDDYEAALDERFATFVNSLYVEDRMSALAGDLVQIGLAAATAFAPLDDVEDLATITVAAAGARSSIDRHVFYERTVPALITAMRAERASIRAEIRRKQRLPADQYSLGDAFRDLRQLQMAGRIDAGMRRLTEAAEADRAAQQARLEAIPLACDELTALTASLFVEFRQLVNDPATRAQRLPLAAAALNLPATATWPEIASAFDQQYCTDQRRRAFIDNVRARINAGESNG